MNAPANPVTTTTMKPMPSEARAPNMTRLKMSRDSAAQGENIITRIDLQIFAVGNRRQSIKTRFKIVQIPLTIAVFA